ncbi:MAG: Ca2+-binding EF-hand superfamily protein [Cyclobacteriaceae bacterium]|jgi:Ca2+-binding EF-hand superfamily protein
MLKDLPSQKLRHLFKILDFDHNGVLQKSDLYGIADNIDIFANLLDDNLKKTYLREDADEIWSLIEDYFQNPTIDMITVDQWLLFMEYHFSGEDMRRVNSNIITVVTRIREIFDINQDRQLSRKEFMAIFVSMRVEVRHAHQCFMEIDTNGDNFISDSELTRATKQFFRSNKTKDCGNQLFGVMGSSHFTTNAYYLNS